MLLVTSNASKGRSQCGAWAPKEETPKEETNTESLSVMGVPTLPPSLAYQESQYLVQDRLCMTQTLQLNNMLTAVSV